MSNQDLVRILDEIADLLDIQGEEGFRANSYRRAARTLGDLTEEVARLAAEGGLDDLPGIGKSMREKIEQFLATGQVALHQELIKAVPPGLPAMLKIPGLGPKKAALLWRELGVEGIDDLRKVIESGALAKVKGMGEKTAAQLKENLEFVSRASERTPLGLALPLADELAAEVRKIPGVKQVEIAGSLRRGAETIGDIDLVCSASNGEKVIEAFAALPAVERVLAKGDTKGSVIARRRDGEEIRAQIRVVPPESIGAAWLYFTGSKEHNVRLRELAIKKHLKLNEWGLFKGEEPIAGRDEKGIYQKLGLPWIPPELREDRGELTAGMKLPKLVERTDIRGDLHMHTSASDGTLTAPQMAEAASRLGYEYIAITDHSKSSAIANGLSIDRMWRQIDKLRKLNERHDTISVLVGCECDILPDGSLDYPDSVLAACDIVVASVHSAMRQDRETVTKRVIAAIENPFVTTIGHPTGRLIGRRQPMDLDMAAVIEAAARTHTALELNASWQRLDLADRYVHMAREAGVMIVIDTDAHAPVQLEQMDLGIRVARRAWLTADHVLNTRPISVVKRWIARKRKPAAKT